MRLDFVHRIHTYLHIGCGGSPQTYEMRSSTRSPSFSRENWTHKPPPNPLIRRYRDYAPNRDPHVLVRRLEVDLRPLRVPQVGLGTRNDEVELKRAADLDEIGVLEEGGVEWAVGSGLRRLSRARGRMKDGIYRCGVIV